MSESTPMSHNPMNWYVVKTKNLAEKKVYERLLAAGFETYLPLLSVWRIWSDRKKKVEKPLIPSVVFVHVSPADLKLIYPILGVASILTYLGKPAIVRDYEIQNLRILLQQEDPETIKTIERFENGEAVEVVRGPFKGVIATAITESSSFRLIVEIKSLGTGFTVNVPKSYVRKLKD